MAEFHAGRKIIALHGRPNAESFGMSAIIAEYDNERYEVLGFNTGAFYVAESYVQRKLGGHILSVSSPLPMGLDVPAALWLGNGFRIKANRLNAPDLPQTDLGWFAPLEPYQDTGQYTIMESGDVCKVLGDWTRLAGIQALMENSAGLASLMDWTLPLSPITEAVDYFTARNEMERQKVLGWQAAIGTQRRTVEDLVQQHERTICLLLSGS
ncbi:MAG TPA: hypothetical protein HA362_06410 [Nanoarchaeota archaeon]|nr:hypothetical protein [Nanoarchaeota archaeon]